MDATTPERWEAETDGDYLARVAADLWQEHLAADTFPKGCGAESVETWCVGGDPERLLVALRVPFGDGLRVTGYPERVDRWLAPGEALEAEDARMLGAWCARELAALCAGARVLVESAGDGSR